MCGLMALCGPVPVDVTALAVAGAARRGPHSCGLAFCDGGPWTVVRDPGALDRWRPIARTGTVLVGHSRLATSTCRPGDKPDPAEGQPLVDGRTTVAHNGTLDGPDIARAAALAGVDGYDGCVDSGVLAAVLAAGAPLGPVLGHTAAPQAALWSDGDDLYAGRYDGADVAAHPLYGLVGPGAEWLAVSSGPLPGGWLLTPNTAHQLWRLP